MTDFYRIASLDEAGVQRIRDLEQALDRHIMAFEPGLDVASLSDGQLAQIRQLEEELGVTLIVYEG